MIPISSIRKRLGQKDNSRVFETHYLIHTADDYVEDVANAQGRFVPNVAPYNQRFCIYCDTINPPIDEPLYPFLIKKGLADSRTHCFRCHSPLLEEDTVAVEPLDSVKTMSSYPQL